MMELYEVLTAAGACRCPWSARVSTVTCPGTVPGGRPFNGAAVEIGAGHLVSWIRHMIEKPGTNAGRSSHYCTIVR